MVFTFKLSMQAEAHDTHGHWTRGTDPTELNRMRKYSSGKGVLSGQRGPASLWSHLSSRLYLHTHVQEARALTQTHALVSTGAWLLLKLCSPEIKHSTWILNTFENTKPKRVWYLKHHRPQRILVDDTLPCGGHVWLLHFIYVGSCCFLCNKRRSKLNRGATSRADSSRLSSGSDASINESECILHPNRPGAEPFLEGGPAATFSLHTRYVVRTPFRLLRTWV